MTGSLTLDTKLALPILHPGKRLEILFVDDGGCATLTVRLTEEQWRALAAAVLADLGDA